MSSRVTRILQILGWTLAWLVALGGTVWAFGALYFDFPIGKNIVAGGYVLTIVAGLVFFRHGGKKIAAAFGGFAIVLAWWLTLKPSHDGEWQDNVAQVAWVEIQGDEFTFHNVRNCDYRTDTDYTPHWETRAVRLSQLTGIDLAINYWGSPWMAHPILSFQFADAPPVCFSIETRRKVGQSYSTIGGFYRQYPLTYIVADERDVIRVRTNYLEEDIYLYRLTLPIEKCQVMFLEYVHSVNKLHARPHWYNALTANCTTSIRGQAAGSVRLPWDWRLLINGKIDEMLYEHGLLSTGGLLFDELKNRSLINKRARSADQDPDFSTRIRVGLPGRTPPSKALNTIK